MFQGCLSPPDVTSWTFGEMAMHSFMFSPSAQVKLPAAWPLIRVEDIFGIAVYARSWLEQSKSNGLAAWQAAQTHTRPPWWSKKDFTALKTMRNILLDLGVNKDDAVVQSWEQWRANAHVPTEKINYTFDSSQ